ncbi:inositol monophosphatase [Roseivivax halodurans JCM 10272]|uniref:Inositol monophosphatase n=1 Tax=Roseivivax halodurans JCM 10272 TaxID=1449350 RepID=X7EGH3_9RHOB|nr:inositol monophosphatase [Roseivivax halodurans]ETX15204.1 inositol monophosphatase [Roseivivax halodurans JCM 10272]
MTESLPIPLTAPISRAQRTQVLNLVRRAARAEILPRFRSLGEAEIDTKSGPQDLATDADREAEKMIARGLLAIWPHARIVGEEDASANPEVIETLREAELGFTIDPVDGTWNFAKGLPLFGVMVAMTRYGRPVWGMLYDPIMDDVIWAGLDGPAELVRGRMRPRTLRVSSGGPLPELSGFTSLHLLPEDKQERFATTFPKLARAVSMRCACHEFRTLAQGGVDFVLATKVTPWDHTPGALIVERAGGVVRMLDGSDYTAGKTEGYLLAACDEATWSRLRDLWDFLLEE